LANGKTPQIESIVKTATSNFSNYAPRNAGGAASPKTETKTKTSTTSAPKTSTKKGKDAI